MADVDLSLSLYPGELAAESVSLARHWSRWRGWPRHHSQVCRGEDYKQYSLFKPFPKNYYWFFFFPRGSLMFSCFLSYLPQAGANMIVSGSAVIGNDDPRSVISLLRTVVAEAIQKRSLDRWDLLFVEIPMATLYQPVLTTHHSSQWDRLSTDISGGRGRVVVVGAGGWGGWCLQRRGRRWPSLKHCCVWSCIVPLQNCLNFILSSHSLSFLNS